MERDPQSLEDRGAGVKALTCDHKGAYGRAAASTVTAKPPLEINALEPGQFKFHEPVIDVLVQVLIVRIRAIDDRASAHLEKSLFRQRHAVPLVGVTVLATGQQVRQRSDRCFGEANAVLLSPDHPRSPFRRRSVRMVSTSICAASMRGAFECLLFPLQK